MNSPNSLEFKRVNPLRAVAGATIFASALALTSGCVVAVRPAPAPVVYEQPVVGAPGEVIVDQEQPAPVVETVGIAPGPGFFWIGGYYHWSGARWVWYRGHYERPPHAGAAWIRPRYEYRGGHRVYIRGYWR
ncbi:MAG TPA: hypothetical protein VII09_00740 [Opitutaceae bacterium]